MNQSQETEDVVVDGPTRLIENAYKARNKCWETGSDWGIAYWDSVIRALVRKYSN